MRLIKTFFLGIIFTLCVVENMAAQDIKFPLDSGIWNFILLEYNFETSSYDNTCYKYFATDEDTVFNSVSYNIIQNGYLDEPGYFRQEGQTVFYVPDPVLYAWNTEANEYPVYDFSLNTGDSVWLYGFTFDTLVSVKVAVLAVDSIAISNGEMRKRIGFGSVPLTLPYSGCYLTWVEGVGQIDYLPFYFWPSENMCVTTNTQTIFDCLAKKKSGNIYGTCNCSTIITGQENIAKIPINIFPNPTSGRFIIEGFFEDDFEIVIYNKLGQFVRQNNINEIDLSDQPAGIYYVVIQTGGQLSTHKVVKY